MNAQNSNSSTGPSNQPAETIAKEGTGAIAGMFKQALEAMKRAPWAAKLILFIQGGSFIVLIVAIGIFFRDPLYGLIALIIGALSTTCVLVKILKILEHVSSELEWKWQREYVDVQKAHFETIGEKLEALRVKAAEHLKTSFNQEINKDLVRANIFLPDCNDARDGYAFRLFMPRSLLKNMNRPQEWNIRFRPGEGATGTCFMEGQKRVTLSKDFALTDEYRNDIHPDLKWIISLPLKGHHQHTVAVLNVDALKKDIDKATLDQFADRLMQELDELEKQIHELPFREIGVALK